MDRGGVLILCHVAALVLALVAAPLAAGPELEGRCSMAMLRRSVEVPLSDDDMVKLAQQAADVANSLAEAVAHKKETMAELNGAIKERKARVDEILEDIRRGTRTEEHEFDWRIDPDTGKAQLIDLQTSEVVEERDATDDEKQLPLPFDMQPEVSNG